MMPVDGRPINISVDARQDPPHVEVQSPVTVNVPEQRAPVVEVTVERQTATTRSVERDAQGNITRIVEE